MREDIQTLLSEINDLHVSTEVTDNILEDGTTYFSFTLQEDYQNGDFDNNYTYRVSIIGFLKRKKDNTENTLEILDSKTQEIIEKFKKLNFKCSYKDESALDNIKKMRITGYATYNQINNKLV